MNPSLTSEIVDYLLRADPPPAEVRRKAVEHIIDGVAVMLAGSRTECARKLVDFVSEKGGKPSSTLVGFESKAYVSDAALVNGTSGHADDYDDTQLSTSPDRIYGLLTHPTVPVLSAALAVGEMERCSGGELLEAFIAGFEVECKLAEAIKPEHYRRGFHTTATIGTFGALAASSRLMGLDEEGLRHALGIGASLSSGIRANFGEAPPRRHCSLKRHHGLLAGGTGLHGGRERPRWEMGVHGDPGRRSRPRKDRGKAGRPLLPLTPRGLHQDVPLRLPRPALHGHAPRDLAG
jgi:2-methylcitrate dehydratase PrpD